MSRKLSNVIDLKGRSLETTDQVLERLFSEHGEALRGFLRVRMARLEADLEDVVQEVFIRLAKLDNLQQRMPAGGDSNRSFILAMANNLVVDLERQKSVRLRFVEREQTRGRDEQGVDHESPEMLAQASQEMERLKQVLIGLKPTWRNAFILNRLMRKSYVETAAEMGVTVKQVERFLKSALIHIQRASIEIFGEEKG